MFEKSINELSEDKNKKKQKRNKTLKLTLKQKRNITYLMMKSNKDLYYKTI